MNMSIQKLRPEVGQRKGSIYQTKPTRLWFLARGYRQADRRYTNGHVVWLHPVTNNVLSEYGQKLTLQVMPFEKYRKNTTRYLKLSGSCGDMYLARLKYLTFIGEIKKGETIDHIDGDTFNNNINNLRAVPKAINFRDAGFMRKLRNKGIRPELFAGVLLDYYERMAVFKATHTHWQYCCLTREDLMRMLVGPSFHVVDPDIIMDLDFDD